MAKRTTKWGQTFTSPRAGLWMREGGVTQIEKSKALGIGWWVSTPKGGFINVFNSLKDALELRWD